MIRGMNLCSIAGCTHEAEEAGMCNMHFTSALVHGALHYTAGDVRRTAERNNKAKQPVTLNGFHMFML